MFFEKRSLINQHLPLCCTRQQFKFLERFSELIKNQTFVYYSNITAATWSINKIIPFTEKISEFFSWVPSATNLAFLPTSSFLTITFEPVQDIICQKHSFLHQLTQNMTTDCLLNYKFSHGGLYRWRENSFPFFISETKRDFH